MEKLIIAKVLKPQGLNGQVKVKFYGNDLDLFVPNLIVYLKDNSSLKVKTVSVRNGFLYLTFEGLGIIEKIEYLRGQDLFVEEQLLKDLEDDEYYVKDLIDCEVFNDEGKFLGTIAEVESYGAADVYTVTNKNSEILFAFVEGIFDLVDLKNKKVIVKQAVLDEVMV